MSSSVYESLVEWTLAIRRAGSPVSSVLARAVTPELARRAIAEPSLERRLNDLQDSARIPVATALGIIITQRHLRHSPRVSLGDALSPLRGRTQALALSAIIGLPSATAFRVIGNALTQVPGPLNLVELVELAASWDQSDLRSRARFLVDFHTSSRA